MNELAEKYAQEMTVWQDVRNLKEFACVSVPEEIDFPLATFSSLKEILSDTLSGGKRLGLVGLLDIPAPIFERVKNAIDGLEIVDAADILNGLRLIKTESEIKCLQKAGELACIGYNKNFCKFVAWDIQHQSYILIVFTIQCPSFFSSSLIFFPVSAFLGFNSSTFL